MTDRAARNLENGRCPNHPAKPIVEGRRACQDCLNRSKRVSKEKKIEKKVSGKCVSCGDAPALLGKTVCRKHLDRTRDANLLRVYGITREEHTLKLIDQGGTCAVCSGLPIDRGILVVDHNHDTGQIRDLLCRSCNIAFGQLEESPRRILALLEYAQKWETK